MKIFHITAFLLAAALCVWLFLDEEAAEPGNLSVFHQEINQCNFCHAPWRGVSDRMCLQCHEFNDVSFMKPELRFHEAEKYCLKCHTEHRGLRGSISGTDHTLFSGKLHCTHCHTDIHAGLFGSICRECHGIKSWDVPGFRHPPQDKRNCSRCHKAPHSHLDKSFWNKIERTHDEILKDISYEDCWRCHTTHDWRHLLMSHPIEDIQEQ